MNDLRTVFQDAASAAPEGTTLVRDVLARAAYERRRTTRRRMTLVAAVGVTSVAAGTAVVLRDPAPRRAPLRVALGANGMAQVAPAGVAHCGGYADVVPGTEVPEAMRLVSRDPALRQVRPAFARRDRSDCGTAAVALALLDVDAEGFTRRQLTLNGPLPAPLDTRGYQDARPVRVREVTGRLVTIHGTASVLAWTGSDGRSWALHSTGNDADAVVAYADALDLPQGGPATLPARLARGYRDLGPTPAQPPGSRYVWYVTYRAGGHDVDVSTDQVRGSVLAGLAGAPPGLARQVVVGGAPGVHLTNGMTFGAGLQILTWQVEPGVHATVSGVGVPYETLSAVARGLRPAAADDPAVTGSR